MAKKRSLWAELQRERANRQRVEQQALRAFEREAAKTAREHEQAERAAIRQAAANERERKRLYIEDRKAEAAAMASDVQARIAELDAILASGLHHESGISYASLKHTAETRPFAVAGLDSRPDLLDMTPTEFEHLVRQLFEAMGMQSWVTQASKDDGVDAVAVNEDPVFGGLCIIQAKRYRGAVGVEPVRALAGVMEDKHATKGIMVTTSWVTKDGHAFAVRHGRIQIMECEEIKYLCKEHLDQDILISLPKPPPQRR